MNNQINTIEKMIAELCPEGVEFRALGTVIRLEKGKQLNKELLSDDGVYPAYNGGVSYSGFTDKYNYDENTTIISQGGASAGFVNFVTTKFYANAHCYEYSEMQANKYVYRLSIVANAISGTPNQSIFSYSPENGLWEDNKGNCLEINEIISVRMWVQGIAS